MAKVEFCTQTQKKRFSRISSSVCLISWKDEAQTMNAELWIRPALAMQTPALQHSRSNPLRDPAEVQLLCSHCAACMQRLQRQFVAGFLLHLFVLPSNSHNPRSGAFLP